MRKRRFSVEEKIRVLREAEAGLTGLDIARKHNISEQTFYRWKRKYGGMDVSEARRLKRLCREHPRYGYRRMTALFRREGWRVNRKRIQRLMRREV